MSLSSELTVLYFNFCVNYVLYCVLIVLYLHDIQIFGEVPRVGSFLFSKHLVRTFSFWVEFVCKLTLVLLLYLI